MSNNEILANVAEQAAAVAAASAAIGDEESAWAAVSEACEAAEATGFAHGDPHSERAWVAASLATKSAEMLTFGTIS